MFRNLQLKAPIVIIDDVAANVRLLGSTLKAFGIKQIVTFTDPQAGLHWLEHNPWDILLLDLDMPAPNGYDILQALGQRNRIEQPVIIVTALNDPQSRRQGLELGANDYICKPIDLAEVMLRVQNCLLLKQATEQLKQVNSQLEARVRERTEQLAESYTALIRALGRAASYRDDDTGEHIYRIGTFAGMLAHGMGMPPEWCDLIRQAAPMHDVGKIGIPDEILLKPGALTPEERTRMQAHAHIGHAILQDPANNELTDMAAQIALAHHEKWDGSGYPNGLAAEAIPLAARIVALCDVYDALRQRRPYKQAWDRQRALGHVREQSGRHFDPNVVKVFEGFIDEIEAIIEHSLPKADRRPSLMDSALLHPKVLG
ncbi:response regulator receiver modulated metal-dependent phosphohydrolase [Pseudomonas sp. StFLB209]|uniref:HD domain-containing phosphohydrolase n=1 Tax=Pseudomonas sp. StFLB209 TaxID=1028989 RepID=UPI0004F68165|nr:HD domain-containing phosphohydrolase [Pseudomonas sp. StFLB209]BAP45257.1 response regulator receiver modulated metal-dependent phosphohydrolase [Pseudomonas sp. StFLB209]